MRTPTSTASIAVVAGLCLATLAGLPLSARADEKALQAELASTSNKLALATAKISEQESALETMRVRADLQAKDLSDATNRIQVLRGEIVRTSELHRQTAGVLKTRESELAQAREENEVKAREISGLERAVSDLRQEIQNLESRGRAAQESAARLSAELQDSQDRIAKLQRELSDPSVLRVRLEKASRSEKRSNGPLLNFEPKRVEVRPDGTIGAVRSEGHSNPAPAKP